MNTAKMRAIAGGWRPALSLAEGLEVRDFGFEI